MKPFSIVYILILIIATCSDQKNPENVESIEDDRKYQLAEVDSYSFRRAYYGHNNLEGTQLDSFMNRRPVSNDVYTNSKDHPLYQSLCEKKVILDGDLNIKSLVPLPDLFDFRAFPKINLSVAIQYLEDPNGIHKPAYELTFSENNNIVLIDSLEFDWPPDVSFYKLDLNKDEKEELLSIYKWYIMNGDNFDIKIYELEYDDRSL